MQATLTWLDLTASDRDKMRRVLDLFKEQGTLDEMGLGSLRDVISDALFPGTSYIQTRLRYVLFIPWLYQRLETRRVRSSDIERVARAAEVDLIGRLKQNDDDKGVIGAVARQSLVRLPSSLYWTALTRWGIFQPEQSQGWYHSHFDALVDGRGVVGRADDPGVIWSQQAHWHPRLPRARRRFPGRRHSRWRVTKPTFCAGASRSVARALSWHGWFGTDRIRRRRTSGRMPMRCAPRRAVGRSRSWRGGSRFTSRVSRCSTTCS